jgi:hypothetical protein
MGWKAVKDHYRIKHIIHVRAEGICIGSGYVPDMMVISHDGRLIKRYEWASNEDLVRYQQEMDANPERLRRLVIQQDTFATSIPVYTYEGGTIIEKFCETPGYPNVTHDGDLMYENTYSTDRDEVILWAKANAQSGIRFYQRRIEEAEKELRDLRTRLTEQEMAAAKLEADYPAVVQNEDE